ncbi:MAG: hypothetical protein SFW65_03650 [Alphaproteobacteria bacterium]|nr:hypothetical protein [Alphaproteobacteria bacterium]
MRILFIDCATYKPYSYETPKKEGLGGAEMITIRIAYGLAQRHHEVFIYNHTDLARAEIEYIYGIGHLGAQTPCPKPDVVIHIRCHTNPSHWKQLFPKARHVIWYHDRAGAWMNKNDSDMEGICVSHSHKINIEQYIPTVEGFIKRPIHVIHNPVVTYPIRQKKIPGRLGFFSAPYKGLERCYELYAKAKRIRPHLTFACSNPGYFANGSLPEDAFNMGQLNHRETCDEISKCEVLFMPVAIIPDSFGLVAPEANAMGTSVLACEFASVLEVASNCGNTLLPANATDNQIITALFELLDSKPLVKADKRFELESILDQWEHFLSKPRAA